MRVDGEMLPKSAAGVSRGEAKSSNHQLRLIAADAYGYSARAGPRRELVQRPLVRARRS
jgi:hypothetical protein